MKKRSNKIKLLDLDTPDLKELLTENVERLSNIYDDCQEFDTEEQSEDDDQNEYLSLYVGVSGNNTYPLVINKAYFMEFIKKNHGLYYDLLKQVRDIESAAANDMINKENF